MPESNVAFEMATAINDMFDCDRFPGATQADQFEALTGALAALCATIASKGNQDNLHAYHGELLLAQSFVIHALGRKIERAFAHGPFATAAAATPVSLEWLRRQMGEDAA